MKKLLFVVNVDWFFLSHRLPIALAAQQQGYAVHVATGLTSRKRELEDYGLSVHPLPLDRRSTSLFSELRTFLAIFQVFRQVRPDIVQLVTIKPVLFGGIAARLLRLPAVVAAVPGLGYLFIARGIRAALSRLLIAPFYRLALGMQNVRVICQNPDDCAMLMRIARLSPEKVTLIAGSGVNLQRFPFHPVPEGTPIVVMAARLLRDKGVFEFVEAARLLRQEGVRARFLLAGEADPDNPASVDDAQKDAWRSEGEVEVLGHCSDIPGLFNEATLVVLPSYREGLPKVLLEAAAGGRAVITTDVPGCRDAILPGQSGLLVPPRDAEALAAAIRALLEDRNLCQKMGRVGRELAEQRYDISLVIAAHLEIYRQITEASG